MADYRVNEAAMTRARELIDDGRVDTSTEWSDAAPSTEDQNAVIDEDGYDAFGAWHLGIDTGASQETKGRFGFPYGDFTEVNRAALIHAKQRAAQNDHHDIAEAADELLQRVDDRSS